MKTRYLLEMFLIFVFILCISHINVMAETILLDDNFDSENGGQGVFNYDNFANWDVMDGSVDLLGNGYYDFLPGNGLYVDLDGTTSDAGNLVSKTAFILEPGDYVLEFRLAGSQRGEVNTVTVTLGSVFSEEFTLESDEPFTTITRNISVLEPTIGKLSFDHSGGDDFGLLLDNVKLTKIVGLTIFPESGNMATTFRFDIGLIVEAEEVSVVGGSATFDGSDVTGFLAGCLIPGTLVSGGQTFRCPGITGSFMGPGSHTLSVTLDLSDGSSVSDTVTWNVKENTEP